MGSTMDVTIVSFLFYTLPTTSISYLSDECQFLEPVKKEVIKRGSCHFQQRWLLDRNYLGQGIMGQGIGEEFYSKPTELYF